MEKRMYSLWLQPEECMSFQNIGAKGHFSAEKLSRKLQGVIDQLAQAYGGPVFEPHVTLVGAFAEESDESAKFSAEKVAQALKKYKIRFDGPTYGETFFQCVFIRCHRDTEVTSAYQRATEVLGLDITLPYRPHLSLLYSATSEETRKEVVSVATRNLSEDPRKLPEGFTVNEVSLWYTQPEDRRLENWGKIATFPLQG